VIIKLILDILARATTMSTIALASVVGCLIIAVSDSSLRPKFFELAAANLGAYIALQRGGSIGDRVKDKEVQPREKQKR
jgi:hypothetical protein